MMNWVRAVIYKMGGRPHSRSIFYSAARNWMANFEEAFHEEVTRFLLAHSIQETLIRTQEGIQIQIVHESVRRNDEFDQFIKEVNHTTPRKSTRDRSYTPRHRRGRHRA